MNRPYGQSSFQQQEQHTRVKVDEDGNVMELRSQVYYSGSQRIRKNQIPPNNNNKLIIEKTSSVVGNFKLVTNNLTTQNSQVRVRAVINTI